MLNFYLVGLLPQVAPQRYWSFRYRKPDPWHYRTNPYEQRKYALTMGQVPDQTFGRVLEVGCAEGVFTQHLAESGRGTQIVGVDVAEEAVERARARLKAFAGVEVYEVDILRADGLGQFDLVFCAETLSHLGSYSRLQAMCERLVSLLEPGGHLVLVDSWPKGRLLHYPFKRHPRLRLLNEHVEHDPLRPYVIRLLERG